MRFNVSYSANNVGSDGIPESVSNFFISYIWKHFGVGFTEIYSSATINPNRTVSTYTEVKLDYNIFMEGIGTAYT